ncbi:MAG: hypothetical protein GY708_25695 [Actinomycetia bacterium]|nr:hypothetical protein [Actinomycetes bacterium]MCP4958328.1 hypothetical protein [Actinomycetes bacterium]
MLRPRSGLVPEGGVLLLGAMVAANCGNLAFHAIASHRLGPESYGALGSLLAVLFAFAVPAGAVQVALSGETARLLARGVGVDSRRLLHRFVVMGIAGGLVAILISPLLSDYLKLGSSYTVMMLGAFVLPATVGLVPRAVLLGAERHRDHARVVIGGAGIRVLLGALLLWWSATLMAALVAIALSEVGLCLMLLVVARDRVPDAWHLTLRPSDFSAAMFALLGLWLLVGADTVLARHYLIEAHSGLYAAAATVGRIGLFIPLAVTSIVYPRIVALAGTRQAGVLVRNSVAAITVVGAVASIGLAIVVKPVVPWIFGARFEVSAAILFGMGLTATAAGVLNLLIHVHLANRSRSAFTAWVGLVLVVIGVGFSHSSAITIVSIACMGSVAAALLAAIALRPQELVGGPSAKVVGVGRPEIVLTGDATACEQFRAELSGTGCEATISIRQFDGAQMSALLSDPRSRVIVDVNRDVHVATVSEAMWVSETFDMPLVAACRWHPRCPSSYATRSKRAGIVGLMFGGGVDLGAGVVVISAQVGHDVALALGTSTSRSVQEVSAAAAWNSPAPRCDVPIHGSVPPRLGAAELARLVRCAVRLRLRTPARNLSSGRRRWMSILGTATTPAAGAT